MRTSTATSCAGLRRVPELDVVRIQDANLAGSPDPTILAWAADEKAR